jgi:TonB family protein
MPPRLSAVSCVAMLLFSALRVAQGQAQPSTNDDVGKTSAPEAVFKVGNGVSAPRVKYGPEPEYSEEARAAAYQGTCVLWLVVGVDGRPRDIKFARRAGMGLDEKAIEAVRTWKFEPARKDGKPVSVQINVEITFSLSGNENAKISKLQKKANAGDAKAELELSTIFFEGRDVPKDDVQGLEFLQRAANRGLAQAQFLMGELAYARGSSYADYVTAYVWYDIARKGGYKRSDKMLKELASKMSAEQLSEARTRAQIWVNTPAK